ncbi:hypothetical protein diail_10885 [Diaporthe ilicicola]|nr:hypothetical protein diail_10885 [Diaporthe ilicicola]
MASYQPAPNSTLGHTSQNSNETQSASPSHHTQYVEGVKDNIWAHPLSTEILAAQEAEAPEGLLNSFDPTSSNGHSRVDFNPTHTCAAQACKETFPNNYALEQHATKAHHKSFLCTCTTKFVRLSTLNRHIAAQTGPKHLFVYCDLNKGFAREDKLFDHLRAAHKFGESAIAQIRGKDRNPAQDGGRAPPTVTTADFAVPVSTPAGYPDGTGGVTLGQIGHTTAPSAGPAWVFDGNFTGFPMPQTGYVAARFTGPTEAFGGGLADFPMYQTGLGVGPSADPSAGSAAGLARVFEDVLTNCQLFDVADFQPFSAAEDFAGLDGDLESFEMNIEI